MQFLGVDDANLHAELHELDAPERLCENLNQLLLHADELDVNQALIRTLPDIMIMCVDVLASITMHWIFD